MIDRDRLCNALDGAILICGDLFLVSLGLVLLTVIRGWILGTDLNTDDLSCAIIAVAAGLSLSIPAGLFLTLYRDSITPRYSEDDT